MDLNKILPLVNRPSRYINNEWNSHKRKVSGSVSVCFCFPDLYELGASNLGIEILYHIVNNMDNAFAERCYSPSFDMETLMRKEKIPLFSLESKTPLKEFDLVGFGLQYELCATNIINMLDLSGIPLKSSSRNERFPIVIGGGPITANPEPLAEFFDAFLIGDGEEGIKDIIEIIEVSKKKNLTKQDILRALANIPGIYIPSFYNVEYNNDGTIKNICPKYDKVPEKIKKRIVKLENASYPIKPIVPFVQTVHNRLNIEIARGCTRGCRFCQAYRYYYPWRVRNINTILNLLKVGLESTGFEEVAFSSLSCTDYPDIEKLLSIVYKEYYSKHLSISLPSLRCDQFSINLAQFLGQNKRANLTFAPEAGTHRLRKVIGKDISDEEILDTLNYAAKSGWQLIKLYFMIGLPTESNEDINAIIELIRKIKKQSPNLHLNVTISPFIPKPHTPFQWYPIQDKDVIREKIRFLENNIPASVKSHNLNASLLEGILARGDRRLSTVIEKVWSKGCRFDQWKEHLQYDIWLESLKESGLLPEFYLYRNRDIKEIFPWDHIILSDTKDILLKEFRNIGSITNKLKNKCSCYSEKKSIPILIISRNIKNEKSISKFRIRFSRQGDVRFLSHLEQIDALRRTMRRTELPLAYSIGFHPQPKISFGPAISVGYESNCEYMEFELTKTVNIKKIQENISQQLPKGFKLLSVKPIPLYFPSLDSLLNMARYSIYGDISEDIIEEFFIYKEIVIKKQKDSKIQYIDVKPLVRSFKKEDDRLILELRFGPKKNVKPEKIIQFLTKKDDFVLSQMLIRREALFIEKPDLSLLEP